MLCDLGDVKQAVGAGEEFDERAELRQPDNFAKVGLADLRNRGDVADHSERLLQTICVARRNVDPTGVIHINLGASLLNDAANGSAALANEIPNLVGGSISANPGLVTFQLSVFTGMWCLSNVPGLVCPY